MFIKNINKSNILSGDKKQKFDDEVKTISFEKETSICKVF